MDSAKLQDITKLEQLSIDAILQVLESRYHNDQIYTNCGDINIAINPFKNIPIYSDQWHFKYDSGKPTTEQPPHIFQIAKFAFERMLDTTTNQVIIVSGESGAGKTESTKYMLKHLMYLCKNQQSELHERIIMVNPLLEAFGNAQTAMNKNSSRFAKFTEVSFDAKGAVVGAVIRDYMLEKSRVVLQSPGEGNFHIFYSFFAGLSQEEKDNYNLLNATDYRILANTDPQLLNDSAHFSKEFKELMKILEIMKFPEIDISTIHTILVSILHLTNIEFLPDDPQGVYVVNEDLIEQCSRLLHLDVNSLATALVVKNVCAVGETLQILKNMDQANDGRDALAKSLYERLFGWIIRKINETLSPTEIRATISCNLGILDISGFENLPKNSFEQLCINIINERMQSFLNNHIFECEKQIYESEGVDWKNIDFKNNDEIIQLFFKHGSANTVFSIINEESRLATSTDKSLVEKLNYFFEEHPHYVKSKRNPHVFQINHFAGQVIYNSDAFLEKNRDDLSQDLLKCMKESKSELISDLFTVKRGPTGTISMTPFNYRVSRKHYYKKTPLAEIHNMTKSISASIRQSMRSSPAKDLRDNIKKTVGKSPVVTVVSYLEKSLDDLLEKMRAAEPLFVRCIKPNHNAKPRNFEKEMVKNQLIYAGIAEVAKVRKTGFFYRKSYKEFQSRYASLLWKGQRKISNTDISNFLEKLGEKNKDFQLGLNKIFMKQDLHAKLEKILRLKQNNSARKIQIAYKRYIKRKELKKLLKVTKKPDVLPPHVSFDVKPADTWSNAETATNSSEDPSENLGDDLHLNDSANYNYVPLDQTERQLGSEDINFQEPVAEDNDEEMKEEQAFWDIFQYIPKERESSEMNTTIIFKIIKIIMYIFLFLVVLSTSTVQKLSLVLFIKFGKKPSDGKHMLLLTAICIPYCIALLVNLGKFLFGRGPLPKYPTITKVLILETFHSVGLLLLVFSVFKKVDLLSALLLMNAVGLIPALGRALFINSSTTEIISLRGFKPPENHMDGSSNENSVSEDNSRRHMIMKAVCKMCDVISLVIQLSPIILFSIGTFHGINTATDKAEAIFALILVSFSCWENFCDDLPRTFYGQKLRNKILSLRCDLDLSRHAMAVISNIWKIGLTFLFVHLKFQDLTDLNFKVKNGDIGNVKGYLPIILLTLSSAFGYYFAYLACKLRMQIFSFSLPLLMSSITAVITPYIFLYFDKDTYEDIFSENFPFNILNFVFGILWYISMQWICRHVWIPKQNRLEKIERLFLNPSYCSVLFEQFILLNRRRHNNKIYRKTDDSSKSVYVVDKDEDIRSRQKASARKRQVNRPDPVVYACATMWHETINEMTQLLKSLFRVSQDNELRRDLKNMNMPKADYYEFEAHIFFDDCMEKDDDDRKITNGFVRELVAIMNDACSSVYKKVMDVGDPLKVLTPYGGQLIWVMPGGCLLYVHLKDKDKIRHKKRWSQIMYMYYLLGFRLTEECQENLLEAIENNQLQDLYSCREREDTNNRDIFAKSTVFDLLSDEITSKANNTFLLALDGDVDFTPDAVLLLIDRMKKNDKVGAACGRIHPVGSGPMVWFQIFEYAVGHWLQKATEHVLGCVLCSPGCFSLFRGSAVMDDNVMRKYAILPTQAGHYLQYDQGEDRWLCTLLLQQGYRVDYSAASDAFTYAPESFNEFFNQRRRWMPSTMANIMDLLGDYKTTTEVNDNISNLYILYQFFLLLATILGPATVMMMIASAIHEVFSLSITYSYLAIIIPNLIFCYICFMTKSATQLNAAALLSAVYAFIMMVVLVGVAISAVKNGVFSPDVLFLTMLVILFIVTALLHPQEKSCLIPGFLYFLCIPSGYLLLVIYSFCNLNVVSWGTREVPKKKTKAEIEEEMREAAEKKKKKGILSNILPSINLKELKELFSRPREHSEEMNVLLETINKNVIRLTKHLVDNEKLPPEMQTNTKMSLSKTLRRSTIKGKNDLAAQVQFEDEGTTDIKCADGDETSLPFWIMDQRIGHGDVVALKETEDEFWKKLIKKYLYPMEKNKNEEKKAAAELINLRNNVCFAMAMANLLWLAINFMFQFRNPTVVPIKYNFQGKEETLKLEVFGLLFIFCFTFVLLLQFIGMLFHRWGTFLHILSITNLQNPFAKKSNKKVVDTKEALAVLRELRYESIERETKKEESQIFKKQAQEYLKESQKPCRVVDIRKSIKNIGNTLYTIRESQAYSSTRNFFGSTNLSRQTSVNYNPKVRWNFSGKHTLNKAFEKRLKKSTTRGQLDSAFSTWKETIRYSRLNNQQERNSASNGIGIADQVITQL